MDYRGYGIKYDDLGMKHQRRHLSALTFVPQSEGDYGQNAQSVRLFQLGKNRLWFPKFYGLREFGPPARNLEREGDAIDLEFHGKLKGEQGGVAAESVKTILDTGGGVMCLPTGFGKTVIAIQLCCQLGKKVLWITNQSNLLEQTKKSFEAFTGCEVGMIKQNRVDTEQPVVIGMLQSISQKVYPKEIFDHFGVVIFDEVHRVPSFVFSRSLFKVGTKYMIGLSATPKRKDGLDAVITEAIGPIIAEVTIQLKIPNVIRIKAKYDATMVEHKNRMDKANIPAMVKDICASRSRNLVIVDAIVSAYDEGRTILVLSERRNHAVELGDLLGKRGKEYGLYLGQMKPAELEVSNNKRVIIGTYSMCGTGYDNKYLNTVLLATSKREITQIVGRILGFRSSGDIKPLIIDIQDTYGVFKSQSYARNAFYKKQKFVLEGNAEPEPTKKPSVGVRTTSSFNRMYEIHAKQGSRIKNKL